MRLGVLSHQNLSYAIGRHLLPSASVVSALNQREPHFSQKMPGSLWFLCQATPEQIATTSLSLRPSFAARILAARIHSSGSSSVVFKPQP